MFARKVVASLLSVGLAVSMLPAPAIAEELASEDSTQQVAKSETASAVEMRINATADEDPWTSFESVEKAEEAAAQQEKEAADAEQGVVKDPVSSLELRLVDAAETEGVELVTTTSEGDEHALLDFTATLSEGLAASYDIVYRAHANGAWLGWVQNGEAAAKDNSVAIDDVQVVLVAKEVQKTAEETEQTQVVEAAATQTAESTQGEAASAVEAAETESAITAEGIEAESVYTPVVTYNVHAQDYGWMSDVTSGGLAGTTGKAKRLEAIRISLPAGTSGGISYKVHAQDYGWMNEVSNGEQAGTTGRAKRLEAIQIWLTGDISKTHDVYYCVHAQNIGWMNWVKNGETSGTTGRALRLEAIKIMLVPKGGDVPASIAGRDSSVKASIAYCAATAGFGWMGWMGNGDTAGTTGVSGVVEGFSAKLVGLDNSQLHYNAHIQNVGWQGEVTGDTAVGVAGSGRRLEAITMRLSGTAEQNYDIYYRCHVSNYGWLNWAKNGDKSGTTGLATPVEAIQVVLVAKGGAAPANDSGRSEAYIGVPTLSYQGHVQNIGWTNWVHSGEVAGTTGRGLRVEALRAEVSDTPYSGEIQIKTHVQNIGWQDYVSQGDYSGTTGRALRVEALCAQLTGELGENFDVWYRVHAQNHGWLGWAKNGEKAGTQAMGMRLEAIQIKILPKGHGAPGSTASAFIDGQNLTKLGYQNPSGYYQVSRRTVSITSEARSPWNYVTPSRIGIWASRDDCVNAFIARAREYLGTPYRWNYSCAPGVGVDCIGLVYQCAYACGMDMGGGTGYNDFNPWAHYITGNSGWHSHDANNFWDYGKAIHVSLDARKPGDVISWSGHVAIYVGDDTMIEAYTGAGVIYSNLWAHGTPRGCIRLFQ